MKDEEVILKSGDKIHFILYRDHASELNVRKSLTEFLKEIKDNPHILWVSGKILNIDDDNTPYYVVLSDGAFNRFKKPTNYVIVQKSCIIKKEVIFTIP